MCEPSEIHRRIQSPTGAASTRASECSTLSMTTPRNVATRTTSSRPTKRLYGENGAGSSIREDLEHIATFYFEAGRLNEALDVVDRQIEQSPGSSDSWMRRGILLNHMERHPEALEAYNQALTFNPTDPESLINRGITLDTLGHLESSSMTSMRRFPSIRFCPMGTSTEGLSSRRWGRTPTLWSLLSVRRGGSRASRSVVRAGLLL